MMHILIPVICEVLIVLTGVTAAAVYIYWSN
jgi:hypothetical protein